MAMAAGYAHIVECASFVGEKLLKEQGINEIITPKKVSFLIQSHKEAIELRKQHKLEKAYELFMEKYKWIKNTYL
jgi:Holliday junction resolvase-like predicted endonuclease